MVKAFEAEKSPNSLLRTTKLDNIKVKSWIPPRFDSTDPLLKSFQADTQVDILELLFGVTFICMRNAIRSRKNTVEFFLTASSSAFSARTTPNQKSSPPLTVKKLYFSPNVAFDSAKKGF